MQKNEKSRFGRREFLLGSTAIAGTMAAGTLLPSGLALEPVLTHRLPLADFQQGFEIMSSGQSGKIILDWDGA